MLFKFTVIILIALNPFACQAAFSEKLPPKSPPPQAASKSEFVNLNCFMKTTNGAVLDLSKLCDRAPETPTKAKLATSKRYDYQKIENFNRTVYGD